MVVYKTFPLEFNVHPRPRSLHYLILFLILKLSLALAPCNSRIYIILSRVRKSMNRKQVIEISNDFSYEFYYIKRDH